MSSTAEVAAAHATFSLVNESRRSVVAKRVDTANSVWSRFRGLMLRAEDDFVAGDALIIDPCSSIHMFFMRFPIDVLYVNREGEIVRIQESIKPWRIGPLYTRGARYVVELPAGTVRASGTRVGDRLRLDSGAEGTTLRKG